MTPHTEANPVRNLLVLMFTVFSSFAGAEGIFDRISANPDLDAFKKEVSAGFDFNKPYREKSVEFYSEDQNHAPTKSTQKLGVFLVEDLVTRLLELHYLKKDPAATLPSDPAYREKVLSIISYMLSENPELVNMPWSRNPSTVPGDWKDTKGRYYFASILRFALAVCDVEMMRYLINWGIYQTPESVYEPITEVRGNRCLDGQALAMDFDTVQFPLRQQTMRTQYVRACMKDPEVRDYLDIFASATAAQLEEVKKVAADGLRDKGCFELTENHPKLPAPVIIDEKDFVPFDPTKSAH